MSSQSIQAEIVVPFNALMKKERLAAIRKEHDRELTLRPSLSKKSQTIAQSKYKADLAETQEAITAMS